MKIDIITDIETLGRSVNCSVLQIGAIAFDRDTTEIVGVFNCGYTAKGEITVNAETLSWWLNTNPELLNKLIQGDTYNSELTEKFSYLETTVRFTENCFSEKAMFAKFAQWIINLANKDGLYYSGGKEIEDIYLWGNGILFDNRLIKEHMEKYGIEYPIFYRNDRDMRTFIEVAADMTGCSSEKEFRTKYVDKKLEEHNAINDCINEYEALKAAFKVVYSDK